MRAHTVLKVTKVINIQWYVYYTTHTYRHMMDIQIVVIIHLIVIRSSNISVVSSSSHQMHLSPSLTEVFRI